MNQAYAPVQPAWSSIPNGQPQGYAPPQQGPEDNWNYGNPAPQNQQYPPQNQIYQPQSGYQNQQYPQQNGYQGSQYPQNQQFQDQQTRNIHQICRKDAKNCFVESLRDAFSFGKVHLNFATYDLSRPAGNRQTNRVSIYIPVGEFLDLCRRMECGEILWTIQNGKQSVFGLQEEEAKKRIAALPPIYQYLGGTSARKLAMRGKARRDGRSESRVIQLRVAYKKDLLLDAKSGPGDESGKGLIVPKFGTKPENSVAVPMSYSLFCQLLLETRIHYQAWLAAQYTKIS